MVNYPVGDYEDVADGSDVSDAVAGASESINYNFCFYDSEQSVGKTQYDLTRFPESYLYVHQADSEKNEYASRAKVLTFMRYDDMGLTEGHFDKIIADLGDETKSRPVGCYRDCGFLRLLLLLRCARSLGFLSRLLCIFFSCLRWLILLT